MTSLFHLFESYTPCSNSSVKIVDGTLSPIAEIGKIQLSNDLTLHSVLHDPSLRCSLIFVSKLTTVNHCLAIFFFQNYPRGGRLAVLGFIVAFISLKIVNK